jgi:hypothetical protein
MHFSFQHLFLKNKVLFSDDVASTFFTFLWVYSTIFSYFKIISKSLFYKHKSVRPIQHCANDMNLHNQFGFECFNTICIRSLVITYNVYILGGCVCSMWDVRSVQIGSFQVVVGVICNVVANWSTLHIRSFSSELRHLKQLFLQGDKRKWI